MFLFTFTRSLEKDKITVAEAPVEFSILNFQALTIKFGHAKPPAKEIQTLLAVLKAIYAKAEAVL